jgi:hypothetical protein
MTLKVAFCKKIVSTSSTRAPVVALAICSEHPNGAVDSALITPLDIADYRRYLMDRKKKPPTANNALGVL